MDKYRTENKFTITDDARLVYNLRPTGQYRKGNVIMENDVAISIQGRYLGDEELSEIAQTIQDALNARYLETDDSKISTGAWVICLNSNLEPLTWGRIMWCDERSASISKGMGAPEVSNYIWDIRYLRAYKSESQTQAAFDDFTLRRYDLAPSNDVR